VQPSEVKCSWCRQDLQPRRGGSPQRFCSAEHRSLFWSALRRWGDRAIAAGILTIADLKSGIVAACTLTEGSQLLSPQTENGRGNIPSPDEPMRFVVEVEHHIVAGLVKLGFIRRDESEELRAIIAGLKRLGWAPNISRVT
jgi:hypothetical protein